jgi:hypothetical protein
MASGPLRVFLSSPGDIGVAGGAQHLANRIPRIELGVWGWGSEPGARGSGHGVSGCLPSPFGATVLRDLATGIAGGGHGTTPLRLGLANGCGLVLSGSKDDDRL